MTIAKDGTLIPQCNNTSKNKGLSESMRLSDMISPFWANEIRARTQY